MQVGISSLLQVTLFDLTGLLALDFLVTYFHD